MDLDTAYSTDTYTTDVLVDAEPAPCCCGGSTTDWSADTYSASSYDSYDPSTYDSYDSSPDGSYVSSTYGDGIYDAGFSADVQLPPVPEAAPAPYEPVSVIPAGQPGGPSLLEPAVQPVADPGSLIVGGVGAFSTDVPADTGGSFVIGGPETFSMDPSVGNTGSFVIGGQSSPGFTIIDPSTGQAPSPFDSSVMVIGPPAPDSWAVTMSNLYGRAAEQGDIMTQILLRDTINSVHDSTMLWTL